MDACYKKFLKEKLKAVILKKKITLTVDELRKACDKATTFPSGLLCNNVVQYVRASPDKVCCDPSNSKDFQKGLAEYKCFWKFRHMTFIEIYNYLLTPDGMKDPWRRLFPLIYDPVTEKFSVDRKHKFYTQCQGIHIFACHILY